MYTRQQNLSDFALLKLFTSKMVISGQKRILITIKNTNKMGYMRLWRSKFGKNNNLCKNYSFYTEMIHLILYKHTFNDLILII